MKRVVCIFELAANSGSSGCLRHPTSTSDRFVNYSGNRLQFKFPVIQGHLNQALNKCALNT